jgi:4-alpha-glucanotransferase
MTLTPDKKIAGILAPLFALRSEDDLGIGDVGTLREFIEWARENGFRLVQMLPINEVGHDNSPYNAISSVAIEPMTLRLEAGSPEELAPEDVEHITQNRQSLRRGSVKYERVRKLKRALLERAFENFQKQGSESRRQIFAEFAAREAGWLQPYAFFRALMERNGEREKWDEWQIEHRDPETARSWLGHQPRDEREQFCTRENFFCYVQWIAHEQWRAISKFAEDRGVALMGDIPFGVGYYSADVYTHRKLFRLNWSGGAPPEPYFKDDEFTMK